MGLVTSFIIFPAADMYYCFACQEGAENYCKDFQLKDFNSQISYFGSIKANILAEYFKTVAVSNLEAFIEGSIGTFDCYLIADVGSFELNCCL